METRNLFETLEKGFGDLPRIDHVEFEDIDDEDLASEYEMAYDAIAAVYRSFAARHNFETLY